MATIIDKSFLVRLILLVLSAHAVNTLSFATILGRNASKYAVGALPHAGFLPKSWAGPISIPNTANDELFFWLFQAEIKTDDLIIWLNGGPGCSSLDGLAKENGPLHFAGNKTAPSTNPYSWTKLSNVLYIDQPVGTGFAGGDDPATTNTIATHDFYGWLKAFYDTFPGLLSQKTHLMGESYSGIYIPYFTQAILTNKAELPLNLKSISIGDGTFGNMAAMTDLVATPFLHQHCRHLKIPQGIMTAFDDADKACGFPAVRQNLSTYPPKGKTFIWGNPEGGNYRLMRRQNAKGNGCNITGPYTPALVKKSVSTCYSGCSTASTALDYLSYNIPCFSPYNIKYTCATTPNNSSFVDYLNTPPMPSLIHAPKNKSLTLCNASVLSTLLSELVPPPAYEILPWILEQGVKVHMYSGDLDALINHWGTEAVLGNMTWNGEQGFRHPPYKPFVVDGKVAGSLGYERNFSYHRFLHAGHAVPYDAPRAALEFVRQVVLGDGRGAQT